MANKTLLRGKKAGILMSGYSEDEVTSLFTGKGIAGFVQKPFRIDKLLKTVQSMLAL